MQIHITWPAGEATAYLEDTPSAKALMAALPITSMANTWGEEVYFEVGIDVELEDDARAVVDPGTVCLWVEGKSLALPFGPTPASHGDECRLVTEVNVLGTIDGDPQMLASIRSGDEVSVETL